MPKWHMDMGMWGLSIGSLFLDRDGPTALSAALSTPISRRLSVLWLSVAVLVNERCPVGGLVGPFANVTLTLSNDPTSRAPMLPPDMNP